MIVKKGGVMGKTIKTDMLKVRITPDLKSKIQAAAEAENRTVSGYIVNLIMRDIAKKQKSVELKTGRKNMTIAERADV